jgi:hypothetical protein
MIAAPRRSICLLGIALLAALLSMPGQVLASAAEITMLTGRGYALDRSGTTRELSRGDAVHVGETLSTGPNSFLNLRFADDSLMLLRPNSRLVVEAFSHPTVAQQTETERPAAAAASAPEGASRAFFRLLKGGLRAVTGAVGRDNPDNYRVTTPVATIGIRGTDFMADIVPDVLRGRITELLDLLRRLQLPPDSSLEDVVVFGVYSGGIDVSSLVGGKVSTITAGQFLAGFGDGMQIYISEPLYLQNNPLPNPEECR